MNFQARLDQAVENALAAYKTALVADSYMGDIETLQHRLRMSVGTVMSFRSAAYNALYPHVDLHQQPALLELTERVDDLISGKRCAGIALDNKFDDIQAELVLRSYGIFRRHFGDRKAAQDNTVKLIKLMVFRSEPGWLAWWRALETMFTNIPSELVAELVDIASTRLAVAGARDKNDGQSTELTEPTDDPAKNPVFLAALEEHAELAKQTLREISGNRPRTMRIRLSVEMLNGLMASTNSVSITVHDDGSVSVSPRGDSQPSFSRETVPGPSL